MDHNVISVPADPYEFVWQTKQVTADKCNNNCDPLAYCSCGLVYGDYKCSCPKGYAGSGNVGQCQSKLVISTFSPQEG